MPGQDRPIMVNPRYGPCGPKMAGPGPIQFCLPFLTWSLLLPLPLLLPRSALFACPSSWLHGGVVDLWASRAGSLWVSSFFCLPFYRQLRFQSSDRALRLYFHAGTRDVFDEMPLMIIYNHIFLFSWRLYMCMLFTLINNRVYIQGNAKLHCTNVHLVFQESCLVFFFFAALLCEEKHRMISFYNDMESSRLPQTKCCYTNQFLLLYPSWLQMLNNCIYAFLHLLFFHFLLLM